MSEREPVSIVGYFVGTATGWDQGGDWQIVLHDFEPYDGFDMPAGNLFVDYESGGLSTYDTDGNETVNKDLVTVLNGFAGRQYYHAKKIAEANVHQSS